MLLTYFSQNIENNNWMDFVRAWNDHLKAVNNDLEENYRHYRWDLNNSTVSIYGEDAIMTYKNGICKGIYFRIDEHTEICLF